MSRCGRYNRSSEQTDPIRVLKRGDILAGPIHGRTQLYKISEWNSGRPGVRAD